MALVVDAHQARRHLPCSSPTATQSLAVSLWVWYLVVIPSTIDTVVEPSNVCFIKNASHALLNHVGCRQYRNDHVGGELVAVHDTHSIYHLKDIHCQVSALSNSLNRPLKDSMPNAPPFTEVYI